MKRVIEHRIHNAWQQSWNLQDINKLHCVKPVIGVLPKMPMRRTDVKLTRLHIGHTRFTQRHLLLGENAPECPSYKVPYIYIFYLSPFNSSFNHHRITFFHTSVLILSDLLGESPHQNLFAFLLKVGFLCLI
ncbi:RNase H domain-containing protein [Trichonephila clavipes]|nr:RNase H domain-containing protein [Trichonephila clavipes]